MLRVACILGVEAGIKICAPVHDAHEFEVQSDAIAEQVRLMQELMAKASAIVLGGFELRSDVKIIPSSERYCDPRGTVMWERVEELLSAKTAKQAPQPAPSTHMPDRAVLQVPPISRPHYRLPAGQGHDGTPPSSEGVPPWDIPCPMASHPLRIII